MDTAQTKERTTAEGGRLRGVDVARAVAVAGMVMVHFGPYPVPDTLAGTFYGLSGGRASVLFALLAGIGVSLLAGSEPGRRPGGTSAVGSRGSSRFRDRSRLALRGALLLPLGLWLQRLDHGALVILQYYAVYFVFAALVIGLSGKRILIGATAALVLGPVIYLSGETFAPDLYVAAPATLGDPLSKLARDLLLSGAYPLITWTAPLMFGIWLGRTDLGSASVRRRLLVGGSAVTVVAAILSALAPSALGGDVMDRGAAASLLTAEPHSQTTLWMAGSMGSACAVLGASLMLARHSRRASRLAWPLVATGQMALSVYVGHLLLLHFAGEVLDPDYVAPALLSVGVFVACAMVVCTVWRARFSRGPIEKALSLPWNVIERILALTRQTSAKGSALRRRKGPHETDGEP